MKPVLVLVASALLAGPVLAQSHDHGAGKHHSPYAGLEKREIKALSNEQLAELRAGRGMGLALPAELNGYPGPLHVLELAERLELTPDQRARTQFLFNEMQRKAAAIGDRMIESEKRLDALFALRLATHEKLTAATTEAASLQGELRATHLSYHIEMNNLLTPKQVAQYAQLRGYSEALMRSR